MKIYLHFTGSGSVPFGTIESVIKEIQGIVIAQEELELRRLRKEIPEVPASAITAAIAQLERPNIQYQAVRVSAVKPGSLGLWIALTAFGWWVLENTLGETLKDAWKESATHEKVKQFFVRSRLDKLRAIQRGINKGVQKVRARDSRKNVEIEVPMYAQLDEEQLELSVRIETSQEQASNMVPTYDELMAKE